MNHNDQDVLKAGAIVIAMMLGGVCFLIWQGSTAIGVDFLTGFKTTLGIIGVFLVLYVSIKLGLSKAIIFPLIGFLLVLSLFPILNYYALDASVKVFNETTNYLGQTVHELSATEITVFWGMWYMKALYLAVGCGLGVLVQRLVAPEDDFF